MGIDQNRDMWVPGSMGFFFLMSPWDFQLTFLSFSFLIYKLQGCMKRELRCRPGLKVQISDYVTKSPSEIWEN